MYHPKCLISWNVNGIMPCIANGKLHPLQSLNADVICFQETRTDQRPIIFPDYHHYWLSGEKQGYAGVLTMSKKKPLSVRYGLGIPQLDGEARLITVEFEKFWSVNAYFPKSQGNLSRHEYRMQWDEALSNWLSALDAEKPVILCGDFNITRAPIDIYPENSRMMWAEQGYMSEERDHLETLLEQGFTDAFRHLYPERVSYTWWSNRLNKRRENKGWRLDYFLVSTSIKDKILNVWHFEKIDGSDHCPIELMVDI